MARNLPAHCGGRSIQSSGNLTKRRIRSDPSGDVLSLRERERQPRTATSGGRNAAARQQHRANAAMWLVNGTPNLILYAQIDQPRSDIMLVEGFR
jgi:hypothetical protein